MTFTRGYGYCLPSQAVAAFIALLHVTRQSIATTATVRSGRDFALALADPNVDTAVLVNDIVLQDSDWEGFTLPLYRAHNITLLGNSSSGRLVVLDCSFQNAKIRLGHMVTFTFRAVSVINITRRNFNMAPSIPMFAASLPGERGMLVMDGSFILIELCYPPDLQGQVADLTPRPDWLPGVQRYQAGLPQSGCVNATVGGIGASSADAPPAERRCWAQRGRFIDVALMLFDLDANQKQVSLGCSGQILDTAYACKQQLTYACVEQLGTVGCMTAWLAGVLMPPPPPEVGQDLASPSSALGAGGGGQGDRGNGSGGGGGVLLGAVLGGAVGGLALAVIATAAALLLRLKRRRNRREVAAAYEVTCDGSPPVSSGGGEVARGGADGAARCRSSFAPAAGVKVADASSPSAAEGASSPVLCSTGLLLQEGESADTTLTGTTATGLAEAAPRPPGAASTIRATVVYADTPVGAPAASSSAAALPSTALPAPDPLAPVTPLTPPRPELCLTARPGHEVTLLPGVLGKGAFGRVVEGLYGGRAVAVKVLLDTSLEGWGIRMDLAALGALGNSTAGAATGAPSDAQQAPAVQGGVVDAALAESFAREVEVLGRCQHPHVVTLLAACLEPPRFCLVMERMETSLDKLLYGRGPGHLLPMGEVLSIALDVARGLEYLHPTVLHRDLKPANVLVNHPGTPRLVAKLSDFGLSRIRSTVMPTLNPEVGTPEYMAPELFTVHNNIVTDRADVYSFGVLLWAMLSGRRPWEGMPMVNIAFRITIQNARPPLDAVPASRLLHKLGRLLRQCWDADPARRPAAAELVKELMLVREQSRRRLW